MTIGTTPLYHSIYALVRQIPEGKVSSYGRIAKVIGTTARTVGFAMAALPPGSDVPWQRVINSQGKISRRTDGEGNILQQDLLELEGVKFSNQGKVNLNSYLHKFTAQNN
jgi:methylated-DNA-protein-cysteine methyltransferase related protein